MVVLGIGFFFLQKYVLAKHMKHPELAQTAVSDGAALAVAGAAEGTEETISDAQTVNRTENNGNTEENVSEENEKNGQ